MQQFRDDIAIVFYSKTEQVKVKFQILIRLLTLAPKI
jgi:hypothetical protein